jgi:16S rRNA (guanine966-N2)-methyltransferase
VREALFAILTGERDLMGARVLDLYAGTGALAFEALSRGAAHATLVEASRAAVEAIEANTRSLDVGRRVHVLPMKVERAGPTLSRKGPFDLLFADPPYALVTSGEAARALAAIVTSTGLLAPDARVVIEHSKNDAPPTIDTLVLGDSRRYGDTMVSLYSAVVGTDA